jgi:hypothetical protein
LICFANPIFDKIASEYNRPYSYLRPISNRFRHQSFSPAISAICVDKSDERVSKSEKSERRPSSQLSNKQTKYQTAAYRSNFTLIMQYQTIIRFQIGKERNNLC